MTTLSFKYAYRHVRAGFGRMALSMIAIALGVALVVAFQLMNAAVLQSFLDTIDAMAGRAQLMVSAGEGLSFSEDVLDKVKAVPGVKLAVPLVRSNAFPDDGSGEMLTVQGVDLTNESAIRVYHDADKPAGSPNSVIEDMVEFLNSPDSIILGKEFADKRGLKKGDKLPLVTPNGVQTFTIKALLEAQGLAQTLRGRIVVMDLFAAERAFTGDRMINQIDVLLNDASAVEPTKNSLQQEVGRGLKVQEPRLRKHLIRHTIAGFQAMVTAFSLLAIVVGVIISYSRLSTIFQARTWQIGLLRSLGMQRGSVAFELLKESLLLSAMGTIIGLVLGHLIGTYALPFFSATTAIALRMPVANAQTNDGPFAYLLGAGLGIIAAVLAALIPAVRVSQTEPVAALRYRGRELPPTSASMRWVVQAVLVLSIAAALAAQMKTGVAEIGLATTVLMAALVCTVATPLVRAARYIVAPIWGALFGAVGRLAAKQLAQNSRRSALTITTSGLGFALVLLLGILEWSFERTLLSIQERQSRADLVISSSSVATGEWGAALNEEVISLLSAIPGAAVVCGQQSTEVADGTGEFFLNSFDEACFRDDRLWTWPLWSDASPNALDQVSSGQAALITQALAYRRGLRAGSTITLASPSGNVDMIVAAVSEVPIEPSVIIGRQLYRQVWNDKTLTLIYVNAEEPAGISRLEASIAERIGSQHRLMIRTRREQIDYFVGQVRQAFGVQHVLTIVAFLLVSVALGDAIASSVIDRTRLFGAMRAVGISQDMLFRVVLLESAVLSLLGFVVALLGGIGLGVFWVEIQFPALVGWAFQFHFPYAVAIEIFIVGCGLSAIASWLPARRAAGLSIPAALRSE